MALRARFEVLAELPAAATHGLFARPGGYDAWVRLSNGSMNIAHNRKPDIRGFAIRVLGVEGNGALGAPTHCQDFALINRETFGFSIPTFSWASSWPVPRGCCRSSPTSSAGSGLAPD